MKIQLAQRSNDFVGYKNRSINAVYGNNRCLFWNAYKTHKYTVCAEYRVFRVTSGGAWPNLM